MTHGHGKRHGNGENGAAGAAERNAETSGRQHAKEGAGGEGGGGGVRKGLCQEAVLRGLVGGVGTLLSVDHEPCDEHGLFVCVFVHVFLRADGSGV
jgi:hypothetical protein